MESMTRTKNCEPVADLVALIIVSKRFPHNCPFVREIDQCIPSHDDVMTWKRFPHYWPCVRETTDDFLE